MNLDKYGSDPSYAFEKFNSADRIRKSVLYWIHSTSTN